MAGIRVRMAAQFANFERFVYIANCCAW